MKKILKGCLPVILAISLMLTTAAFAAAENTSSDPAARELTVQEYSALQLKETGGTPGVINVMLNGSFINFGGQLPEMTNGTVYVPFRVFFDVLGARIGYDDTEKMITAQFYDRTIAFRAGEAKMNITENRKTRAEEIGAAPYIKNGTSYIPLRAVSEVLGLSVFWDGAHESVVIIDLEKVMAEINRSFSAANTIMNMPLRLYNTEGAFKTTMNISAELTQFDSIKGDTVTPVTAGITAIQDGKSFSVTAKLDMSALVGLLYPEMSNSIKPPVAAAELEKEFENAEAELIFNYDEDTLYFKTPFVNALDSSFPADAWIRIGGVSKRLKAMGIDEEYLETAKEAFSLADMLGADSVGALVYHDARYYTEYDQIQLYGKLQEIAADYRLLLSDVNFRKGGDTYSFSVPWDKYLETLEGYELYSAPAKDDFRVNAIIKTDGKSVTGLSIDYYLLEGGYSSFLYACDLAMSRAAIDLRLELHSKNQMKAVFEIDSKTDKTTIPVPTAPPPSDRIVSIEQLSSDSAQGILEIIAALAGLTLTA